MDDNDWLRREYASVYRTVCLVQLGPQGAEQVVQAALLRLWQFRDAVPDGQARRAWLYRVVVRACTRRDRADQPVRPTGDVLTALADLPEDLRVVLVLRHVAGLPDEQIAVATGRRAATVRSLLRQAGQQYLAVPVLEAAR